MRARRRPGSPARRSALNARADRQLQHGVWRRPRGRAETLLAGRGRGDATPMATPARALGFFAGDHRRRGTRLLRLRRRVDPGGRRLHPVDQPESVSREGLRRRGLLVEPRTPSTRRARACSSITNASTWSSLSDVNSEGELQRSCPVRTCWRRIAAMPVRRVELQGSGRRDPPHRTDRAGLPRRLRPGRRPARISTIDADGVALAAVRALEARTPRRTTKRPDAARTRSCGRGWPRLRSGCSTSR